MRHDLTQPLRDDTPVYLGDPPVSVTPAATMRADGYRVTRLSLSTHAGTHVDAPSHLIADGATLDDYPISEFSLDARLVDADADARAPIEPSVLPDDGDADVVVVRTGYDAHWGSATYRNHPYLAPETAERLARRGQHLALDAASPDPSPPVDTETSGEPDGYPAHRALFASGLLVFENLRNLAGLPERFRLDAYPLRVDADGAPVRAVAVTDD